MSYLPVSLFPPLRRALQLRGEDAVQPAVHPGSGCSLLQVQPRRKAGLECDWSAQEGRSQTEAQELIHCEMPVPKLIFSGILLKYVSD